MKYINDNKDLMKYLTGDHSLISSIINRIDIYMGKYQLNIDIYVDLLYSPQKERVKLRFIDIQEYSFLYNYEYSFYNIERYKLFSIKNGFYACFDPCNEENEISTNDQDYILCKKIEGYFV